MFQLHETDIIVLLLLLMLDKEEAILWYGWICQDQKVYMDHPAWSEQNGEVDLGKKGTEFRRIWKEKGNYCKLFQNKQYKRCLAIQFCIWQYLDLDFTWLVNDNEKEALSTYENNLNVKEYFLSLVHLLAYCVYNKSLIPFKCKYFLNLQVVENRNWQ